MTRNQNSNHASQCSSSSSYPLPGFTLLPPLPGHTRPSNGSIHNYDYVSAALDEALQISRELEGIVQMMDDGHRSAQGSTRRNHSRSEQGERQ
jgi:hypothetical protein